KGEVIDLPAGSTPLDFAYRVHTEIGHHCAGARVNGRLVALDYRLRTGDVVEIITSPQAHPTRDWLEIVQSSHAKAKVRRWLRARVREESYEAGRDAVRQAAARLPAGEREQLDWDRLTEVAHQFGYPDEETLLAAVGYGDIEPDTVVRRLLEKAPPRPTTLAEEVQLKL
ncbi:MAG: bifunctional (p)ppGpp synthetase/guanosine-3',5'-bis(diphosphate) 3'-pyrophosphohydrolase, partial [Chloroflexi bacterium]|nr:bifunctional (p)ppGpp synthetase/guanosine-3',5'-bis(diphosphate) 3'-pyrophosphohydrolase [Chloroflexota bacterium]